MTATFLDMNDEANTLNGEIIRDNEHLIQIFEILRSKPPFVCKFLGENGFHLDVGIGPNGCAQYGRSDGEPPYLMAVAPGKELQQEREGDETEFALGGTATPISNRFCMPFEAVREIVGHFLQNGDPHPAFVWEPV
jgi:Immunity protein Imm1